MSKSVIRQNFRTNPCLHLAEHWSCSLKIYFGQQGTLIQFRVKYTFNLLSPSLFRYLFPFCNDKQNKICIKSIKCFFKRDKYNRNSKQISANKSRNTKKWWCKIIVTFKHRLSQFIANSIFFLSFSSLSLPLGIVLCEFLFSCAFDSRVHLYLWHIAYDMFGKSQSNLYKCIEHNEQCR